VSRVDFIPAMLVAGVGMGAVIAPFFDIALGDVSDDEVGSASGLLNAIQQLGGSIGVAVLTTLFITLLGGAVTSSVNDVTPALKTQLTATGIPAVAQASIISQFRSCVHDRATADDPAAVPASCTAGTPISPQVEKVLADQFKLASKDIFTDAAKKLLLVDAGLMVVLAGLSLLLPSKARPEPDFGAGSGPASVPSSEYVVLTS
jgi:hypothetical protein